MKKHELIEKYFSNKLSKEEFEELGQILGNDSELRGEFYEELEIKSSIAQEKHSSLKKRLQALDKTKKKNRWIPYAAAVALLIGIGTLIYSLPPNHQDLYAENFEVYPNVINPLKRSENTQKTNETVAFELYEAGRYSEAAQAFTDIYQKEPKDYLLFYKGVSLLAQSRTEEGIQALQSYDWEGNGSDFAAASNWYLSLACLKQKEVGKAKTFLKKVATSESNLNNQARELLKQLD